ncbi:metal ABC transporter permease [Desulfurobacterium indicum]|uniref:ABC transporter n=1 Tax=Desulfurobacterium indicum TaxID=1914305 RepID=A0A1R1MN43_9BACT|nr:metal ABC transporter permease [Desulfurobacterium indicum]OMH41169.1 ABC transporter [Desulfurobacterium indicum]
MISVENPLEFLKYGIFIKALIGSVLSGFICSIVGVYVFLRKMSFIGAGLAHIAFAGIAFGLLLGSFPLFWGFLFAFVASSAIWFLSYKGRLTFDATIGILFATSMGLAVLFLGISGKYRSEALYYLFGSPLMVESSDVWILAITAVLIAILTFSFYKEIYLTVFSEEIAKASGIPVEIVTFTATSFITVAVIGAMKAVGALLVFSLLVMPPASAYELTDSFGRMIVLSILFGLTSAFLGVILSLTFNVPSGSTITLVSFLLFLLSYIKRRRF